MPYIESRRGDHPGLISNVTTEPGQKPKTQLTSIFTGASYVNSYRTGSRALESVQTAWTPNPNWSIAERLRARKEYLEGIDRDLANYNGAPLIYTSGHTNAFQSIKVVNSGTLTTHKIDSSGRVRNSSFGPVAANALAPASASGLLPLTSTAIGGLTCGFSSNIVQNYSSAMHHALNPLRNAMGVGETMAEIVRGNMPKLTSRFFNLLKSSDALTVLKKSHKAASQDYLNANFGLGPVFQDLYNLLIKGIVIHDSLYGQSYRRRADSPLVSDVTSYSSPMGVNLGGYRTTNNGQLGFYLAAGGSDPGIPKTVSYFQDMKFTARFTLARSSGVADTFYDKALLLVQRYGLWTPSLLWDLTPWTWILDWFLHLGRGFQNAFYYGTDGGLLSDYSCVTTKTVTQHSIPGYTTTRTDFPWTYKASWSSIYTTLTEIRRYPTNPFGTFVDLKSLSAWQQAILVALGLARKK